MQNKLKSKLDWIVPIVLCLGLVITIMYGLFWVVKIHDVNEQIQQRESQETQIINAIGGFGK